LSVNLVKYLFCYKYCHLWWKDDHNVDRPTISDIPVTETETHTEMIGFSKTDT